MTYWGREVLHLVTLNLHDNFRVGFTFDRICTPVLFINISDASYLKRVVLSKKNKKCRSITEHIYSDTRKGSSIKPLPINWDQDQAIWCYQEVWITAQSQELYKLPSQNLGIDIIVIWSKMEPHADSVYFWWRIWGTQETILCGDVGLGLEWTSKILPCSCNIPVIFQSGCIF